MNDRLRTDLSRALMPLLRAANVVPFPSSPASRLGLAFGLPYENVEHNNAYRLVPTIQFCVDTYQTTISATPLRFYVGTGDDKEEIQRAPGNIVDLWAKANTQDTGIDLMDQIVGSLELHGNAYLFKQYILSQRMPDQLWALNPMDVRPIPAKDNARSTIGYKVRTDGKEVTVPPEQICHLKRYDPDFGMLGLSRVGALKLAYETKRDADRFMRAFYRRGGMAAGHYSTDQALDADDIERLKTDLREQQGGPENAWEPVLLPRKLKFERAGLTFAEMQFVESNNLTKTDMLMLYKIHPILASEQVAAGLNSEVAFTAMLMFLRFGAVPVAQRIAAGLNERLLNTPTGRREFGDNVSCEFDFTNDPVMVDARLKQMKTWTEIVGGPFATRSEARDGTGFPPRPEEPELDEVLVPLGASTASQDAKLFGNPDAPPVPSDATDPNAQASRLRRRLDRARSRNERLLRVAERRVRVETVRLFLRQRRRILARLRAEERWLRAVDLDVLLSEIDDPQDRVRVKRLIRAIVRDTGDAAIADLAKDLAFSLATKQVQRFIEEKSLAYITKVNSTTKDALRIALSEGIGQSETLGQLVSRVDDVFDKRRSNSQTIARTETAAAYNFATTEAYRQSGVVTQKMWVTAGDEAVRDAHAAAEGQVVALSASFVVGGEELDFPGDPSGSPGNIANCRCTTVPVVVPSTEEGVPKGLGDDARSGDATRVRFPLPSLGDLTVEEWLANGKA